MTRVKTGRYIFRVVDVFINYPTPTKIIRANTY